MKIQVNPWLLVVIGILVCACPFGCTPKKARVFGLIDQIPQCTPAGPWRVAAYLPKSALLEHLETYRAVNLTHQEGALLSTKRVSSFMLREEIRPGERLLTAMRYRRSCGDKSALEIRIGGRHAPRSWQVPLGNHSAIVECDTVDYGAKWV